MSNLLLDPLDLGHNGVASPLSVLSARTKRLSTQSYKLLDAPSPEACHFGLDVTLSDKVEFSADEMSCWVNFADGNRRDQTGDLLEIGGIDTSRHRTNPIVLFDHGKQVTLPIALAEDPKTKQYTVVLDPITKVGRCKAYFYRGTGIKGVGKSQEYDHALLCEQLFDLICNKFVRAGSIGYIVKSADHFSPFERDKEGNPVGLHLLSVLMLEASAVVQPMNQDTVRKVLAMPKICGKPLSRVLHKSFSGYVPVNTTTSISIPHGNLSETDIPPPRAKPGWIDQKAQDFLDRIARTCQTYSTIQGSEDWMNRLFANPVNRHTYWISDEGLESKKASKVEKMLKDAGASEVTISKDLPTGMDWQVLTKDSYFANCPRDASGRCVPQNAAPNKDKPVGGHGSGSSRTPKPPQRDKPDARQPASTQGASGAREEVWSKGKLGVLIREGEVIKSGDPSIKVGSKVTEDQMIKMGWTRVEPKAATPQGEPMATPTKSVPKPKGKALPPNDPNKAKQIPPSAPPEDDFDPSTPPTDDVPMTADPAMDAEVNPEVDATELAAQDGADAAVDVDPELAEDPAEPYGAQYVRQVYEDFKNLVDDYHKLMGPLDNERILRWAEKKMAWLDKTMQEMETLFPQVYGGRGVRDLGAMEEASGDPMGTGAPDPLSGDVAGDDVSMETGGIDPMGDDPGMPADSDPLDRPDPHEVAQNMKRPDIKGVKAIREHYRQKAMGVCKDCGEINCKCSHTKAITPVPETKAVETEKKAADEAFTETDKPGHKTLGEREMKWLSDTKDFLKSLSDEKALLDDEKRLECKGWHKLMEEVEKAFPTGDYSAHFGKKPNKPDHKMSADLEQEVTDEVGVKDHLPSLIKAATDFLASMAREKAFGTNHREYAGTMAKALEEAMTKNVPDEFSEPTAKQEEEQLGDMSGTEGSIDGYKALQEQQTKDLENITKQLEMLNSVMLQMN